MRLINTKTLKLEEFQSHIPTYAILSHTWGDEEVSFVDWQDNLSDFRIKSGFDKIQKSCHQARLDGYDYLWCDTNCIDKRSSAELSEAINSMFSWYKNSSVCYAYLADVQPGDLQSFSSSRWFTRGWTLQELLAPKSFIFFAKDWSVFGTRNSLSEKIFEITKIKKDHTGDNIHQVSVSERMSWVSHRETTRVEDIAYCMLGIFDINMPLLYGEGNKAFIRLQEEIIRVSNDQSIFCWEWNRECVPENWPSMLSPSPKTFENSGSYYRPPWANDSLSYATSNSGLSISLKLLTIAYTRTLWPTTAYRSFDSKGCRYLAVLDVACHDTKQHVAIVLQKLPLSRRYARFSFPHRPTPINNVSGIPLSSLYVAGPRDQQLLMAQSPMSINAPRFGLFVTVSCPSKISAISTKPEVDHHCWTHALRPLTDNLFGAVFVVKLVVDLPSGQPSTDSIAVFCFVGVDATSIEEFFCQILEIRGTVDDRFVVEENVAYYESKIRDSVRSSGFPDGKSSAFPSDFMSISDEAVWLHSGSWVRISDSSRVSVAHITIPMVPPFRFPSKVKPGLLST
ncbi:hypothetical protein FVEN_g2852 [Fusarium venenatum]|uniref:Uncharacterized protein n=1 Tax=Fusarium venenatum TaxID=56646 RepID=A0A2L2T963_9HYPO|nr:uncharacterized protein FVRRES_06227 [Fusarium venenatum]KAG8359559.1 hypothetical protein FVEN_g2852 [Fusarium venenatum]CEI61791.1 unnamed protein product [Fusarium venenatum]